MAYTLNQLKRYATYGALLILALLGLSLYVYMHHGAGSPPTSVAALPKEDKEQIIVDPHAHTIIIKRPTGTTITHLPDRETVIDVRKDGSVLVTAPQWGLEHRFFFGVHGSEAFRLAAGMDAFYFKKLDVGLGVAGQLGAYTPIIFAQVSYNVWGNCRLGLAYGTNRYVGGSFTVRL